MATSTLQATPDVQTAPDLRVNLRLWPQQYKTALQQYIDQNKNDSILIDENKLGRRPLEALPINHLFSLQKGNYTDYFFLSSDGNLYSRIEYATDWQQTPIFSADRQLHDKVGELGVVYNNLNNYCSRLHDLRITPRQIETLFGGNIPEAMKRHVEGQMHGVV